MGTIQAIDMADHINDLDQLLIWHLQSNHYPPVPLSMLGACHEAIDALVADDFDMLIDLPEGVLYRGQSEAPAWAIAEAHHLYSFITED